MDLALNREILWHFVPQNDHRVWRCLRVHVPNKRGGSGAIPIISSFLHSRRHPLHLCDRALRRREAHLERAAFGIWEFCA